MKILKRVLKGIIAHARADAPVEACGYLAGTEGQISDFYPLKNADGREDHFSFLPEEQFAVHKSIRQAGRQIIAVYHSHPESPAGPSAEDIRLAYDPALLYVIVSLADETPVVKGFWIREGVVREVSFNVEEEI